MATFYRRWFKIGAGIAGGVGTVVALLAFLISQYDFEITGTDAFCNIGEPCISDIKVCNPTVFNVDVYNQDEVKLEFSPEVKDYKLFRKDGRCSGLPGSSCCSPDGVCLKGWKYTDFTPATRPLKDKVYVQRFPAKTCMNFKLWGLKSKPGNVKWTFTADPGLIDGTLDPTWYDYDEGSLTVAVSKYPFVADEGAMPMNYSGLVGWWSFEEGNGSFWNDSSGNNIFFAGNGTLEAAPIFSIDGAVDGSYKFDGIDDYLESPAATELDISGVSPVSMAIWVRTAVKPAGVNRVFPIMMTETGYQSGTYDKGFSFNSTGLPSFFLSSGGGRYAGATTDITDDSWHFIVGTFNGSLMSMYVDGVLEGTGSSPGSFNFASPQLVLSNMPASSESFNGTLDEAVVWNRTLTSGEVAFLYNKTKNIYTEHDLGLSINGLYAINDTVHGTGVVYDWKLNNESIAFINLPFDLNNSLINGTTVMDYSSFANNAEYNGTTTTFPLWNRTGGYNGMGAYKFDGIDDHLNIPKMSTFNTTTQWTINTWIKVDELPSVKQYPFVISTDYIIAPNEGGYLVQIESQDTYSAYVVNGTGGRIDYCNSTTAVTANTWYLVTTTFNYTGTTGILKCYFDGILEGENSTLDYHPPGNNQPTTIGILPSASSNNFNGTIDQFQVYNRTLSPEQIAEIYSTGIGRYNIIKSTETSVGETWSAAVTIINSSSTQTDPLNSSSAFIEYGYQCTCPDGDVDNWIVDVGDNCVLSTDCNMSSSQLSFAGDNTGTFTYGANILLQVGIVKNRIGTIIHQAGSKVWRYM